MLLNEADFEMISNRRSVCASPSGSFPLSCGWAPGTWWCSCRSSSSSGPWWCPGAESRPAHRSSPQTHMSGGFKLLWRDEEEFTLHTSSTERDAHQWESDRNIRTRSRLSSFLLQRKPNNPSCSAQRLLTQRTNWNERIFWTPPLIS